MELSEFKSIPEYPEYLVSKDGEVYSTKSNRLLKSRPNSRGYLQFAVTYGGKSKFLLVSRAVARVWGDLPSLDSELEVDHINGDTSTNYTDNLQALSKENHLSKTKESKGWKTNSTVCSCGEPKGASSHVCKRCKLKNPDITLELIEYWVTNYSWVRAGKELGFSDNGIRKRYVALGGNLSSLRKPSKKRPL